MNERDCQVLAYSLFQLDPGQIKDTYFNQQVLYRFQNQRAFCLIQGGLAMKQRLIYSVVLVVGTLACTLAIARDEGTVSVNPPKKAGSASGTVQVNSPPESKPHRATRKEESRSGKTDMWVACPVQEVQTQVITTLPGDWWQTTQMGELKSTAVTNIAGKPTLSCRYKAYGNLVSVMRLYPPGVSRCIAKKGGFSCS